MFSITFPVSSVNHLPWHSSLNGSICLPVLFHGWKWNSALETETEVFGVSWMTAIQKLVKSIQVGLETSHLQLLYFVMLKAFGLINWGTKNTNLHINWFSLETTKTRKKRIVEVPKASWYRPMPQRLQLVLCTSSCIQSLIKNWTWRIGKGGFLLPF